MKNKIKLTIISVFLLIITNYTFSQKINDSNTPLHLLQPDYDTPYGKPKMEDIKAVLDRVYNYLAQTTPTKLIDKNSVEVLSDFSQINENTAFQPGDFRLISYEWGVTYAGMLRASETSGDPKYAEYTEQRLEFISEVRPYFIELEEKNPGTRTALHSVLHPRALDDAGAMCAAMIKTQRTGLDVDLDPMIRNYIDYIMNKQFRLEDGTLARNRPQPNTLWLDDLFMSIPALAQMGKYTGDKKYYDEAVAQVLLFAKRMFNYEKGLFMHGWVQGMEEHPEFHWARANGWAVMTMVELLEVLPEDHEGYPKILDLLQRHIHGLCNYQSPLGFWHQLIDKNDSYLETSATAIYTYAIARAINRGYVDAKVYGPRVCLAWNAVSTKVTEKGQVEGTCVGTGMGFDPAFYYYRPVNVYAAHGYGPVLLAGAEMIQLIKTHKIEINDSALMFYSDNNREKTNEWKFDFGDGAAKEGFQKTGSKTTYSEEAGFGFVNTTDISAKQTSEDALTGDFVTSDNPIYFNVKVPEGRYKVTVTLGDKKGTSETTVKAESRRLMLENIKTGRGEVVEKTFLLDVRSPQINATESIKRKPREMVFNNWDDKLNLEFNGKNPCVSSVTIEKIKNVPVIFLAGNSTVTDQEYEPWASWGQMFPRFLKPEVVVANFAESGETLLAFKSENRLKKVLSEMKPGDYLFIEFAHNDQKPGWTHVEPFTTYKDELKYFINEARKKGGKPVLVTSMHRRNFNEKGEIINTLDNYPEAMRQTAQEENIPLIDLNVMSKKFYEAMGPEDSKKAFVHYPAATFPDQEKPLADNTHFNPYGAYELAKCIVQGIKDNKMELAKYMIDGLPEYDPSNPDDFNSFYWPQSLPASTVKPEGN